MSNACHREGEVKLQGKPGHNPRGDNWVVGIEEEVREDVQAERVEIWRKHSIYRVPPHLKDINPKAYEPQVVSFGPYHHGEEHLRPMEEHKHRSLRHLLRRCRKPLGLFVAAVKEVVQQLMEAYEQLDVKWRDDQERFVQLMVLDGCFMLEIMRATTTHNHGYAQNDPIFGCTRLQHTARYVRRDARLLENQLPLLLLQKLETVETGVIKEDASFLNGMVCKFFLGPDEKFPSMPTLRLHPLDVWMAVVLDLTTPRRPLAQQRGCQDARIAFKALSATELSHAGVCFQLNTRLEDNWFENGVLSLPLIWINLTTEVYFLNLMAFEQLHADAGNQITSFVYFMARIAKSDEDLALLRSHGILQDAVGDDKWIAAMVDRVSTVAAVDPGGHLGDVLQRMHQYCCRPWRRWRARVVRTYFRIPGTGYSLTGAMVILGLTVMQAVYAVLQYHAQTASQR